MRTLIDYLPSMLSKQHHLEVQPVLKSPTS